MVGWLAGWLAGWMDGWIDRSIDQFRQTDRPTDRQTQLSHLSLPSVYQPDDVDILVTWNTPDAKVMRLFIQTVSSTSVPRATRCWAGRSGCVWPMANGLVPCLPVSVSNNSISNSNNNNNNNNKGNNHEFLYFVRRKL